MIHDIALAQRLLDHIDLISRDVSNARLSTTDIVAHQVLWGQYVAMGASRFGEAVLRSLRAICRSAFVDHVDGGIYRFGGDQEPRGRHLEKTLGDNARLLELLTWVWRVERCPELRTCAEEIVAWTLETLRVPGFGFAASADADARDKGIPADGNGLMLVALVEAGSVFERRDCLALARDIFDELAANLEGPAKPSRNVATDARGTTGFVDHRATMSRAAIRLFEAFGKRRYLDQAKTWVATLETTLRDVAEPRMLDGALLMDSALMIGVLARLRRLTGTSRYAEHAKQLVEVAESVTTRSGILGTTITASAELAAQLVSIEVSGDPRLPETRELMRIALECGLPDRMVLGPGAGGERGERPFARISVGASRLSPIDKAAQLRTMLAPGGLAAAFVRLDPRETVDTPRKHGLI